MGQFPVAAQEADHVPAARVCLGGHGERGAGRLPAAPERGLQAKAALLHHSDRGVQYASGAMKALLAEQGATASMSRRGNCYDNAMAKSVVEVP